MLKINVKPEAVRSLLEESREVPSERIEELKTKLDQLSENLEDWEGNASTEHKAALTRLHDTLDNSQLLMTEILNTIDYSMQQFSDVDHEISAELEKRVDFHQNN